MTSRFTHRTDLTRAPSRTPRRLERRQLLCERMEPRRLMATMAEGFEPGASAADVIPGAPKAEPAAIVCEGAQVAGDKLADCFMPVVDRTAEPEADLQPGPNKDLPSAPDCFLPVAIDLVDEYQRFVAQNPTWPEEHGAGGIQLMVITPSRHLPWIELGTPGEARSFDAWYEQTYLDIVIDDPLPPNVDGLTDCFLPVIDQPTKPDADLPRGTIDRLPSPVVCVLPVAIDLVAEYRRFVAQNPTWPEEHGAGGIQLMVITPSRHLPWIELGTPGEARSFDAWYEQTYLDIVVDEPLPPNVDAAGPQDGGKPSSPERDGPVSSPAIDASDRVAESARPASLSRGNAAWATLFATYAGVESGGVTPLGGRRRSR